MSSTRTTSKIPESSGQPPPAGGGGGLECESCRSAPGIPFCRVDWSFLCFGCASIVHGNNCVVSVPLNPNSNFTHPPYHHYPFPHNPFANPSPDPNAAAHLSSEDDDLSPSQIPGKAASRRRLESVMRYREKRKSRRFEKTVRYENRRAYAESRPRTDGKFAGRKDGGEKEAGTGDAEVGEDSGEEGAAPGFMGMDLVSARPDGGAELGGLVAAGGELGQHAFVEDVRFQ